MNRMLMVPRWTLVLISFGFLFFSSDAFSQSIDPKLIPPKQRSTLAILGSPTCNISFDNSNPGSNEPGQQSQFWGRIGYFDVNAKGEILISICRDPEDKNRSSETQCQNLFKGDAGELCEKEKNSRNGNSVARGIFSIVGTAMPHLGLALSVIPNPNDESKKTIGTQVQEGLVPALKEVREIRNVDCTATISLLQILRDEMHCPVGNNHQSDYYCKEQPDSHCAFAKAIEVFANTTTNIARARDLKEPKVRIFKLDKDGYRFSVETDDWYGKFLRNEEQAQAARRAASPLQPPQPVTLPAPRVPQSPRPGRR